MGGERASARDEVDELDLAERCVRGERAAQRFAFERLRAPIHRTLYRIMGSNRHTKDLVQDAFLEVFKSIGGFRGESSLAGWANRVAARVAYRHLTRREPPILHLAVVPDPSSEVDRPDRLAEAREAARRLYAILDRLDPKYRIAYALHVVDGRPLAEVAQITDVTRVAAKNRVWRARRMVHERARRDPLLRDFLERAEGRP